MISTTYSLPPVKEILSSLASSYEKQAFKLFEESPLSYGLCQKDKCFCDSEECINNTPKSHSVDLGTHLEDTIELFPLNNEKELEECLEHMECLFKSFTTPVEPAVRLVWNLQAAGYQVNANVLYLSDREKGELVCELMGWDKAVKNSFNSGHINGVEVPSFSYSPEVGLLVK